MKKILFLFLFLFLILPNINALENKNYPQKDSKSVLNDLDKYLELENVSINFIEKNLKK